MKFLVFCLLFFAIVIYAASATDRPSCLTDDDCPRHQLCIETASHVECNYDNPCISGTCAYVGNNF